MSFLAPPGMTVMAGGSKGFEAASPSNPLLKNLCDCHFERSEKSPAFSSLRITTSTFCAEVMHLLEHSFLLQRSSASQLLLLHHPQRNLLPAIIHNHGIHSRLQTCNVQGKAIASFHGIYHSLLYSPAIKVNNRDG